MLKLSRRICFLFVSKQLNKLENSCGQLNMKLQKHI